jgi:hypothetical protein
VEIIEQLTASKEQTLMYFELDDAELDKTYASGKWSIRHILHHLADAETVLYDRIRRVISEPRPVVWSFDQDAWARELDYAHLPLYLSRQIYASVRDGIIYQAQTHYLSKGHLEFVHNEAGLGKLKDLFERVASHNTRHLNQIERALSAS